MKKWTPEQQEAISLRQLNLLVAAAAGSGKTAVLVERVIQLLLQDKVDIDQMLVVTFTKAAASEMRERISHALIEALHQPGPHVPHIRRQLTRLQRASISTLHSFCTEVIRRYYYLVDVDPVFKVADQNETDLLRREAVEAVLEAAYEQAAPEFSGLIEMFAPGKSDQGFRDLLLQMYDFVQSQPQPWLWLQTHTDRYQLDADALADSPWVKVLMESAQVQIEAARERFMEAIEVCSQPGGPEQYVKSLQEDVRITEALEKAISQGAEGFHTAAASFTHSRLRAVRGGDEALKEAAKALREEGKNLLKALQKGLARQSLTQWSWELNRLYPYISYLNDLMHAFAEEYLLRKKEKRILDFNDLEHFALHILRDPQAAGEYRQRFEFIFVDEYQDSNLVQETLLNCIARGDNLFMVGDVKQSIYRFRLADPGLFLEKYLLYRDQQQSGCQRVDLAMNFRSQPGIIAAVNHVFAHIMNRHVGELEYDREAFLRYGLKLPEEASAPVKVVLIDKDCQPASEGEADRGDVVREAEVVAAAIKEMVGQPFYDAAAEEYRPLQYRDVVILLRATRNWSAEFMEVFAEQGIPSYADVNSGYFGAVEVEVMLNLLKLIDNHYQDIPLLSVLRSPLFNLSSADLIAIRMEKADAPFYEAFEAYSLKKADPLAQRAGEIRALLAAWRREARYLPVEQLIWHIYTQTGYYHYAAALPGGQQRQANLRILAERARQFENSSLRGLYNFIRFVENLLAGQRDLETARILGENDNVVRVMSVHKSKGLEFPVVIVAGLGRSFNLSDSRAAVVLHKNLGLGSRYVDLNLRRRSDSIASLAVKERLRLESLAEEMRILYVAMTRAKSRLMLVGTVKDISHKALSWRRPLGCYELSQARGLMDWLGPLWLRHPDGGALRNCLEEAVPVEAWQDEVNWQIEVVKSSELYALEQQRRDLREEVLVSAAASCDCGDEAMKEDLAARFQWRYPFGGAAQLPSKLTVTQLKKAAATGPQYHYTTIPSLNKRPRFMSREEDKGKTELKAAQRGTVLHYVMQHVDLGHVDQAGLQAQLEAMVKADMLTTLEAQSVDVGKIEAFFASLLGKRILSARRVLRETGFNQLVDASRVLADTSAAGEKLLLQGVIDLFFEEADGLVVVDYKTDNISSYNRQDLISQYQTQVKAYCGALAEISGKPVKQGFIYFFHNSEAVQVV